jgi:hypothetical protein
MKAPESFLACVPDAIPRHARAAHFKLAQRLFRRTRTGFRDLPDGYAFRFPAAAYDEVAAFVRNERACCPAISFELRVEPASGPLWLSMRGPAGAREFLAAELPLGLPSAPVRGKSRATRDGTDAPASPTTRGKAARAPSRAPGRAAA